MALAVLLSGCGGAGDVSSVPPAPSEIVNSAPVESETPSISVGNDAPTDDGQDVSPGPVDSEQGDLLLAVGDTVLTATLADNSSAQALRELLAEGPLTIDMSDFGNMEKVGPIGRDLPRNDEPITTEAGDLILYQGNAFVLYYAPNTWNFTRLGEVNDITAEELRELLGSGDVTITLSLADIQAENGASNMSMQTLQSREFHDLAYGDSSAQALDLYLPKEGNGPWPLVFFVHGGGWFSGDKKDGQEIPWVPLRDHGYAVASVNYRLSGEAPHPAGIEDCETALRFLTENAAAYHIDPAHVATAGGSSGGHYALMLALDSEKFDISCCVAWYPATDLAETMRTVQDGEYTGFGADFAWSNIERYIGKTITDVNDSALVDASPINHVSADMPPVLLQHGDADTICPIDQSLRFRDAVIRVAGEDRVAMTVLEGAEHGDSAFAREENMAVVQEFLAKYMQ